MYFTPTAKLPAIGNWHSAHGATIVLGHPECPFTIADTGILCMYCIMPSIKCDPVMSRAGLCCAVCWHRPKQPFVAKALHIAVSSLD